jgi:integrase
MPPRRKLAPSYVEHKQSGRGRLVWYDATGTRQQKLLPGVFGSPESLTAKARLEMELAASPTRQPAIEPSAFTVAQLLDIYLDHAERHYRGPDGKPTSKLSEVKSVITVVLEYHSDLPAGEFTPLKLKAVRQKWVDAKRVRTECNRCVGTVKRIFKWGVSEELVPPAVYQALATVSGLQKGRTEAKEGEPVGPVEDAIVDATLPHLNRYVRGLVEFQRLTGCRPGEACALRRCDIDTGGPVWLYKPSTHKTAYRGKSRIVAIGPKAQELLKGFFIASIDDYLFSPRRAVEEHHAARSANRKTPPYPSHLKLKAARKMPHAKKPAERYNRSAYIHAIDRACDRAFPLPAELAPRERESQAKWWKRLTKEQQGEVKEYRKAHRWHGVGDQAGVGG